MPFSTHQEIDEASPGSPYSPSTASTPAVDAATQTFQSNVTKPLEWRIKQLRKAWWMLEDNKERIVDALKTDLHKHRQEALPIDVVGVQSAILEALKHIKSWNADERPARTNPLNFLGGARIRREPKGVALIISAWNYPFMELFEPLAAALAAGCTAVLKPSELAPASQDLIARIVPEYLDRDAVRVVTAGPAEMDHLLGRKFDHIFFTGSTAVGKIIYARAAPTLTTVTLELGGRGPAIVTARADVDLAARRIANVKFLNSGQVCVGVNHVFVDPKVKAPFLAALAKYFDKYLGGGHAAGASTVNPGHVTNIINDRHYNRLEGLLEKSSGNIIYGGGRDPATRYFAPTVVDNVTTDDALLSEELFGPILPVLDATLDEAIAYTAAHDHPLSLYGFTESTAERRAILERTRSGGVTFNDGVLHMAMKDAPFGGVGASGTGAYHGIYGFREFTHLRTVAAIPGWADALLSFRYPPYTNAKALAQIKATGGGATVPFDREGRATTTLLGRILGQWKLLVLLAVVLRWRGWTLDDVRNLVG
ncbi:Aldehyde dehydrogenase NAD(P)-dependent [Cordyceps fumosorosea ARSEF 2679]|uniref:Aldehyde dehydrogenase n=1 Tax=Cordyceps fumosorosea (strain ARSEF 2679) TaxID=1081104 RepID=A0A168ENC3_CORFA|nr:Aldehyde dehydrogenase NAD(P)-dependent [Cordyceps fumosorosea ARSEF 2679]OAA74020.1 Aldehyde dehydrogenase NAD(P)-dependent [Cordyceps fumosorosea ARSEF 2679]